MITTIQSGARVMTALVRRLGNDVKVQPASRQAVRTHTVQIDVGESRLDNYQYKGYECLENQELLQ